MRHLHQCFQCRRHHSELICPFCGVAANRPTFTPDEDSPPQRTPAPVYGAPPGLIPVHTPVGRLVIGCLLLLLLALLVAGFVVLALHTV